VARGRCNHFNPLRTSIHSGEADWIVPPLHKSEKSASGAPASGVSNSFPFNYKGTLITRKLTPLGPYRRPMPRVLGGSYRETQLSLIHRSVTRVRSPREARQPGPSLSRLTSSPGSPRFCFTLLLTPPAPLRPGSNPGANGWFLKSTPIQMLPRRGSICGRLT
jgi:hypothetical protein